MHRIGISVVFVGAIIWITAGAVVFSPHISDTAHVASASVAYGGNYAKYVAVSDSSDGYTPGEGSYYIDRYTSTHPTRLDTFIAQIHPWYVTLFSGFGKMFQRIIPGQAGSVSGVVTVPVTQTESRAPLPPTCVISINPNSVPHDGFATISWTSRNADHVIFQGIGEVGKSGSLPVNHLTSTRAFALAVQGDGGTSSCYTVVNVESLVVEALVH
ncbi:MAG: hypothetical protein Q8R25_02580 [bacterium]|nr:hypothetical protein [bacterium]